VSLLPLASPALATDVAVRDVVLGRSAQGRPVHLTRIGDPRAPVRVLVVGAIHGNEPAGRAVVARLRARPPRLPGDVALWLIDALNPDGVAAGTRQNARGVDLNRNFPDRWRFQGAPWNTFYSGRRPLSEPESRLAARFIARLRPAVTIWYPQALRLGDVGTVADRRVPWRYARTVGLPAVHQLFLPGLATRWENHTIAGGSAFVVELPGGPLDLRSVARHARAVRDAALQARHDRAARSPGPGGRGPRTLR
jgi:protein MpaA